MFKLYGTDPALEVFSSCKQPVYIVCRKISCIIPHLDRISERVKDILMNSIIRYFSFFILFTGLCASAAAATTDDTLAFLGTEDIFLEDMPIVISATRLEQPLNEAPVATTVIDRQMIEASGAQTIADVLRLVPGFTVGYIAGNYPVATYHGHSDRYSKRIQLVIDGRSVYLPTLSGVSWSDLIITLDDIERIEVVRGPNASTYGNNAFLAVVSITTRHAAEDQGHYVKNTIGSHDTSDVIYRFGGNNNDLDYRVTVGTKNNEGTDQLDDFTETDYLSYRLDYQIDTSTHLFYQGGIQDSTYGDLLENDTDTPNDIDIKTAFQHIKYEHSFNENYSLSLQYYYNYTNSLDEDLPQTVSLSSLTQGTAYEPVFANIDDFDIVNRVDLESERHDLEVNIYYQPLDSLRLVSGVSVRADKVIADNVFNPAADDTLFLSRFFTHGEYRVTDDWILNAGLMIEDNDISGTDIAPRLAIIHHLTDQHTIRVSASQATRTPTLFDENAYYAIQQQLTQDGGQPLNNPLIENALGGDVLIDPYYYSSGNLASEEITSYELGWMSQLLDNKLILDFKVFTDKTDKLIEIVPYDGDVPTENVDDLFGPDYDSSGATDFANASKTETQGMEFYGDYQITMDWRLYAYFSYTEIDAERTDPAAEPGVEGRLEESAPRRSYGAMLMKQWPHNLNTSLAIYHVSDMDWLDRTHSRTDPVTNLYKDRSAEEYTRIDLVLRKSFISGNNQVEYSFILQNLGSSYSDYSRTNYTDPTLTTENVPGSEQDTRGYFELAFKFN